MTADEVSDLYRRICEITIKYTFTHPVEALDVETVRAELLAVAPEAQIGVNPTPRGDFVGVVVTVDNRRVYQRMMRVQGRNL